MAFIVTRPHPAMPATRAAFISALLLFLWAGPGPLRSVRGRSLPMLAHENCGEA